MYEILTVFEDETIFNSYSTLHPYYYHLRPTRKQKGDMYTYKQQKAQGKQQKKKKKKMKPEL